MHGQMWMRVSIFCNLLIDRIGFCPKPNPYKPEAYTWNRDLYRQWATGGACWLDRDPDNDNDPDNPGDFQQYQQVISNLSATADRKNGAPGASGFQNNDYSINILILIDSQLQQNEKYGGVQNARVDVDACVHILQSADREDRILPETEQNPNPGEIYPPLSFSNC